MKKIALILLVAFGAASFGFGGACERICTDPGYGVCDSSAEENCNEKIMDMQKKCLDKCKRARESH